MATLAIQIISAINVIPKDVSKGCNPFVIVKFFGHEIFRTELCEGTTDPVWQHVETKPISVFRGKEKEYNRSCFLERLDVEVYNVDRNNKAALVSVTKLHLFNTASPAWYSLYDPGNHGKDLRSRVLVGLTLLEEEGLPDGRILNFMKLSEVLSTSSYPYMYIDFNWSASASIGSTVLPALESGEVVMDKRDNVQWDISLGSNAFGDRHQLTCKGSLVLTDIRVIFIPAEVVYSPWMGLSFGGDNRPLSEEQQLLIRRLTYILPISCLQELKVASALDGGATIALFGRDGSAVEFLVTKQTPTPVTSYQQYRAGLRTDEVSPLVWCSRVCEELQWQLKEGKTWVKFAKLLRKECENKLINRMSTYTTVSEITQMVDIAADFRRLRVTEEWEWEPSTLNGQYKLCSTYPQLLYFPKNFLEEDINLAAKVRSRNRLSVLSWLHPVTGIPITRAAQPKTGIGGNSDIDRRLLLAIAHSSMSGHGHALRIIDARPYINAQANALRGKGFENVGFLGGSAVAALAFMDIQNIHVMRSSINRLREECSLSNIESSGIIASNTSGSSSTGTQSGTPADKTFGPGGSSGDKMDGIVQSKWLHHIATVLRAAVTTADSILLNHPVLIHCSDGWDRTAQLSGLASLMLDPFYRTIEGVFVVIEKEFISFGHQFEHRCGKTSHKETSPVFLQFLDCLYQLISQFPTKFEFSARMLSLFANLAYSGLFVAFNKNCEKDTMKTLSQYCTDDILEKEDLPYTSVFTYVRVMLSSSVGDSLINPYYQPPRKSTLIDYIRPKYGVSDVLVWEEGLYSGAVAGISRFHTNVPSAEECSVFLTGSNTRYLHYLESHLHDLPPSVIQTLEYLHSSHTHTLSPVISYCRGQKTTHSTLRTCCASTSDANAFLNTSAILLMSESVIDGSSISDRMALAAAVRLQIWSHDPVIKELCNAGMQDIISAPSRAVRNVLKIFITSELKHLRARRQHQLLVSRRIVSDVLNDIMDDILLICKRAATSDMRDSLAQLNRVSYEGTDRLSDQPVGRMGAFTRTFAGFGSLLTGRKAAESIDFSDNEDDDDGSVDDEDDGIGVMGAIKGTNRDISDGFAARMFRFR